MARDRDIVTKRGVFCIETAVWSGATEDKTSMRPILQWLHDVYGTPFLHRDAICREEFLRYLRMWGDMRAGSSGEGEQYPILILSYHGDIEGIWVTDDTEDTDDEDDTSFVTMEEIAYHLEGCCENKVVHFASCSTINVSNTALGDFLKKTNASAVSGYAVEVDWAKSMAFDLLYLEAIQVASYTYLTPKRMKEVSDSLRGGEESRIDPYPYDALRKALGFDIRERTRPA